MDTLMFPISINAHWERQDDGSIDRPSLYIKQMKYSINLQQCISGISFTDSRYRNVADITHETKHAL